MQNITPEPLSHVLRTYWNVNALSDDWFEGAKRMLSHTQQETLFKQQLADAILHKSVSPSEYERLTREDFDTSEDLEERLREIWRDMYGDEPVTLDNSRHAVRV